SRPPVVSGDRCLCVLDDGRVRLIELPAMKEVKTFRLKVRKDFRPLPIEQGFLLIDSDNKVEILSRDGTVPRKFNLATNVVIRDAAVINGIVYLAAGEVGALSLDPAVDDSIRSSSPKFTASLAPGPGKTVLMHRPQVGVVSFDPATGAEKVILQHSSD